MKRAFLVVLACCSSWLTQAQPALNSSDLPQAGMTYTRANALPPLFGPDLEETGENFTWDYSSLVATQETETPHFSMGSASFTAQFIFSSADHYTAFELPDFGEGEFDLPISGASVYREFGGSAYQTIGLGIATDLLELPVVYEDAEELLPLPLTYGAFLESTSAFEVDLPGILFYATDQESTIEVDGWGTLLLPGASHECLRVKRTFSAEDTVSLSATELGFSLPREGTVYEWYAPGEGMPVLSVQTFADIPAVWQFKPVPSATAQIDRPHGWSLGPNPLRVDSWLHCPGWAGKTICVQDLLGQVFFEGTLDTETARSGLDTKGWPAKGYLMTDVATGHTCRLLIQ